MFRKMILIAMILLPACSYEDPYPEEINPEIDASCPPPEPVDPKFCATIDKLRGQLYDSAGIPTLACEDDSDCKGACVCGGCGVPE